MCQLLCVNNPARAPLLLKLSAAHITHTYLPIRVDPGGTPRIVIHNIIVYTVTLVPIPNAIVPNGLQKENSAFRKNYI